MGHIQCKAVIPAPRTEVFEYLTDPARLVEGLLDHIEVENLNEGRALIKGNEYRFTMTRFGLSQAVRFLVVDLVPGDLLKLRLTEGLFEKWIQSESYEDHGPEETLVTDFVDYQVPLGLLGHLVDDLVVRRDLRQILEHRLQKAREHFGKD